jgi:hypothetical protein
MALPKEVPALTEKDMLKGGIISADSTKRCLVGWWAASLRAERVGYEALRQATGKPTVRLVDFNDRPGVSLSNLAAVWNKAMRLLGYVRRGKKFVLPKAVKR